MNILRQYGLLIIVILLVLFGAWASFKKNRP